jgi:hypothetical protein
MLSNAGWTTIAHSSAPRNVITTFGTIALPIQEVGVNSKAISVPTDHLLLNENVSTELHLQV